LLAKGDELVNLIFPFFSKYGDSELLRKLRVFSFSSGIMGGSPCPVEVMKQVITKLNMPQVTVSE